MNKKDWSGKLSNTCADGDYIYKLVTITIQLRDLQVLDLGFQR